MALPVGVASVVVHIHVFVNKRSCFLGYVLCYHGTNSSSTSLVSWTGLAVVVCCIARGLPW